MRYKNIIWDWNGTLYNDFQIGHEIFNLLVGMQEILPFSVEEFRERYRHPISDIYHEIGFSFSKHPMEEVGHKYIEEYMKKNSAIEFFPDTFSALQRVQKSSVSQYIVSAFANNELQEIIQEHNIQNFFEGIYGIPSKDGGRKESIAQLCIETHNIVPEETVIIGDTVHDFEVSEIIGTACILIHGGWDTKAKMKQCGCPVVESRTEAIDLLL